MGGSFLVLGGVGRKMISEAPPIPLRVIATDGNKLFEGSTIQDGQNVWQSLGGQEAGSIWGHGAYVAPDWSADWLHWEAVFILDTWARQEGVAGYAALNAEHQAALRARLRGCRRHGLYFGSQRTLEHERPPVSDPLLGMKPTPSQRATMKFFYVVAVRMAHPGCAWSHHRALRQRLGVNLLLARWLWS